MIGTAYARTRRGPLAIMGCAAMVFGVTGLIGGSGNASAVAPNTAGVPAVAGRAVVDAVLPAAEGGATPRIQAMTYGKTGLSPREVRRAVGVEQRQCKRSNATHDRFKQQEVDYCEPAVPSMYLLAATLAEVGPTHWAIKRDMTTASGDTKIVVSRYDRRTRSGRVVSTGHVEVAIPNSDGTTSQQTVTYFVVARYQDRQAVLSLVFIDPNSPGTAREAINRADRATGILAHRYGIR